MRKAWLAAAAAILLAFTGAAGLPEAHAAPLLQDGESLSIRTRPITQFQRGSDATRFGKLTFLGGLDLSLPAKKYGGISALITQEGGASHLAVTDDARWIAFELQQDASGRPLGITSARTALALDPKGAVLQNSKAWDTEGMTLGINGKRTELFVSVERVNRIYRFAWPLTSGKAKALSQVETPEGFRKLRGNKGPEALAGSALSSPLKGGLVAIGERNPDAARNTLPGFIIGGPLAGSFEIERSGEFDATEAEFLPGGDLLLLERRFNMQDWIGMRLRRFKGSEIRPGAKLKGEILLEAGPSHEIDNMEALGIHKDAAGRVILTLMSDNNRSLLQRTLLLRFRLDD
ncbi:esterase-like activity of phytase family protein [Pannonibacter phragmitetus]|uniref:esterase-like activity of phytase family protein n=1 Tax=Pannonibacter phragmitetus TaxID=121719 RepID=UPI000F44C1D3|nr:esterase-like activity of phytase family protein [Pannonibacter phragmitetus]